MHLNLPIITLFWWDRERLMGVDHQGIFLVFLHNIGVIHNINSTLPQNII